KNTAPAGNPPCHGPEGCASALKVGVPATRAGRLHSSGPRFAKTGGDGTPGSFPPTPETTSPPPPAPRREARPALRPVPRTAALRWLTRSPWRSKSGRVCADSPRWSWDRLVSPGSYWIHRPSGRTNRSRARFLRCTGEAKAVLAKYLKILNQPFSRGEAERASVS